MSDNSFQISRRSVLAGLGTIGVASAGAGLGTTAFFSDREDFTDNVLRAGELDLKVDWQQMYYGPSEQLEPVSAFPDTNGDNIQDELYTRAELSANPELLGLPADATAAEIEEAYRNQFTNVPDHFQAGEALIQLDDVKPGDWGEVTFSLHLFDNPGYLWMGGDLIGNFENGVNEPELADPDEDDPGDGSSEGELADEIEVCLWYDEDCDNQFDEGGISGEVDVMLVMDESGSMTSEPNKFQNAKDGAKQLVDSLGAGAQAGLVSYDGSAYMRQVLTSSKTDVKNAIDALSAGGSTNMGAGVQYAHEELTGNDVSSIAASGNARASAAPVMVFLTNGNANTGPNPVTAANAAKADGVEVFTIAYGSNANATTLAQMASDPENSHAFVSADIGDVEAIFGQISQVLAGERKIFEGSLAEMMAMLQGGLPLDGDRSTEPEVDAGVLSGRECYVNSTTNCIGFKWELPVNHANEIQSDSAEFSLYFYGEQCRHNDGEMNPFGGDNATDIINGSQVA